MIQEATIDPMLVTVSWDTCKVSPHCEGCYVDYIKSMDPNDNKYPKTFTIDNFKKSFDQFKGITQFIFNVNCVDDLLIVYKLVEKYKLWPFSRMLPPFMAVIPIPMLPLLKRPPVDIAISVNTWDSRHRNILASLDPLVLDHTINKRHSVSLEVSFNQISLFGNDQVDLCESISAFVDAFGIKTKATRILLNYVKVQNDRKTARDVFSAMTRMVPRLRGAPVGISPCILAGADISPKPCLKYTVLDYVDGKLRSIGCPWPHRPCEQI